MLGAEHGGDDGVEDGDAGDVPGGNGAAELGGEDEVGGPATELDHM